MELFLDILEFLGLARQCYPFKVHALRHWRPMGGQARMPSSRNFVTQPVRRLLRASVAVGKKAEMVMTNKYDKGIGDSQVKRIEKRLTMNTRQILIGLQCNVAGMFCELLGIPLRF